MTINALIISEEDFKQRNFLDWIISHISGSLPPHRYKGIIELLPEGIYFNGTDSRLKQETEFFIAKQEIHQVYHGYDKLYSIWQTRSLGLNWAPVRLKISHGNNFSSGYLYFIAGLSKPGTANRDLFNYLTEWLS